MLARCSSSGYPRRRLIGGLAVVGLSLLTAGCEPKLPIVPTKTAAQTPRRIEPAPLPPAKPPASPGTKVGAIFGRVLTLEGVTIEQDAVRAGDYLRIWLHWHLTAEPQEDLRSIGRLVTIGGRVAASEDDQIGGRKRHLTRWKVGDRVIDEMRVRIAPSAASGEYDLAIGVLRPDNQTAVQITSRQPVGSDWQEDSVLVGAVVVADA